MAVYLPAFLRFANTPAFSRPGPAGSVNLRRRRRCCRACDESLAAATTGGRSLQGFNDSVQPSRSATSKVMMWALVLGAGPNSVCLSPPLVINKDQAIMLCKSSPNAWLSSRITRMSVTQASR